MNLPTTETEKDVLISELLLALSSIQDWLMYGDILNDPHKTYLKQFHDANDLTVKALAAAKASGYVIPKPLIEPDHPPMTAEPRRR